ncbi:DUF397 domain-containing protein [Nonomuraea jabiensis]|uniref:DUF397 domain-containing protein n=1 Tax=Nonomuraea jabiensis TaxID=882448 RepID=UPI003D758C7F
MGRWCSRTASPGSHHVGPRASGGNGGDCVEVAPLSGGRVAMRDSEDKGEGPALVFAGSEWAAFKDGMSKGEFDF